MAGILGIQPFKAIYILLAGLFEVARLPLWILLYVTPHGRPHAEWTMSQAIRVKVVKRFIFHASVSRMRTPLSLQPGKEGDRFVVVRPQDSDAYRGKANDELVKPDKIGAVWTPAPLRTGQVGDVDVVLHLHGGAYMFGNGRDEDTGFAAKTFLKHGRVTHVFTPAYRLASNPGGRFPAALQDAISCYMHLTKTLRIPASRITISGDSAGGNLALALLRYINDHGEALGLPWPACVWLWSPWVDIEAGTDPLNIIKSPQYHTDYLTGAFGQWAGEAFCTHHKPSDPYISPIGQLFTSKSPIFLQTGRREVLYEDNIEIYKQFSANGTQIELVVKEHAPHDIILVGQIVGFAREAAEVTKAAGEFLRGNRLSVSL